MLWGDAFLQAHLSSTNKQRPALKHSNTIQPNIIYSGDLQRLSLIIPPMRSQRPSILTASYAPNRVSLAQHGLGFFFVNRRKSLLYRFRSLSDAPVVSGCVKPGHSGVGGSTGDVGVRGSDIFSSLNGLSVRKPVSTKHLLGTCHSSSKANSGTPTLVHEDAMAVLEHFLQGCRR